MAEGSVELKLMLRQPDEERGETQEAEEIVEATEKSMLDSKAKDEQLETFITQFKFDSMPEDSDDAPLLCMTACK